MKGIEQLLQLVSDPSQRQAFLTRVRPHLSPEDYERVDLLCQLVVTIGQDNLTKLQHILFGRKTETTDRVCPADEPSSPPKSERRPKGHGRRGASQYTGALWIFVNHPSLQSGQQCLECKKGRLRAQRQRAVILRITGSPPICATGWSLEKLRCDTCGKLFTAPAPPEAGTSKYDPSVGVTVAFLRYGSGMPHYRLARLQQSLGVPLPESTQWELLPPLYEAALPAYTHLLRQSAQSPLVYHDDTSMRILDLRRSGSAEEIDPKRTGTFTTSIVAHIGEFQIALFMTGWRHAGENLAQVLEHRAAELAPPIQMCDALFRNTCGEFESILANCLSHGRRQFVPLASNFPEQTRFVLEKIRQVYCADAEAKEQRLNAPQRLLHHQTHSKPAMDELHQWLTKQLQEKKVEPNSGLGQAINYLLNHWEPLTLFLRQEGAPLDNNLCERALKMAILHRKNSLSYKTVRGAQTGDLFMSLIHTCRLNQINPYDYLLAMAKNPRQVKEHPEAWMPWNYPKPGIDSG